MVTKNYDVAVCGAGIAGIAAAIAAARRGMRVVLIEKQCIIGGLATSGLINIYLPLCDGYGHQTSGGLNEEMIRRCVEYGPFDLPENWGGPAGGNTGVTITAAKRFRCGFSPAGFTLTLDKMLKEAEVDLWLDTCICDVETADGRVVAIEVANNSGLIRIEAGCFVDATGSASVVRFAGGKVAFEDNYVTPWLFDVSPDPKKYVFSGGTNLRRIGKVEERTLFGPCDSGRRVTQFVRDTWECLRNVYDAVPAEARRQEYPLQLPAMPQLRKIARIESLRDLGDEDISKHFTDSVGVVSDWRRPNPVWETPYRSLLPSETRGVITAGRCIGAYGLAWEIFRVIPAAAITGEAAGVAAALAVKSKCDPTELAVDDVRAELLANGGILDARPEFGVDPASGDAKLRKVKVNPEE